MLVGHSLGGEELSSIGSRYPDKVAGLVYIVAAIQNGIQRYSEITPPILAIYALPHAGILDPALDAKSEAIAKAFEAALPNARVVRIPQANHFVLLSHEADVLREMDAFLGTLK